MAKKSAIEKNQRRAQMVKKCDTKRRRLKAVIADLSLPPEERFQAVIKLSEMPRSGSPVRVRNRCHFSGRPRGVYRKFMLSRIALRDLAANGKIPGMVKASW